MCRLLPRHRSAGEGGDGGRGVTGRRMIVPIGQGVGVAPKFAGVGTREAALVKPHRHLRINRREPIPRRLAFRASDIGGAVEQLPLQIRKLDLIEIDEADRADAGGGEIKCGGRSQATRADA